MCASPMLLAWVKARAGAGVAVRAMVDLALALVLGLHKIKTIFRRVNEPSSYKNKIL